ncbi:hypothetical protein E2C01_059499 [Portunus trituberculatus]|uniref:Uncharacterized protein n=1 Tax=Portunus trituberculatus TaxID=210409 RepID=A0A5B7H6V7_PORTR|nr:hypothetical protein [Portunus trituberculatus]
MKSFRPRGCSAAHDSRIARAPPWRGGDFFDKPVESLAGLKCRPRQIREAAYRTSILSSCSLPFPVFPIKEASVVARAFISHVSQLE